MTSSASDNRRKLIPEHAADLQRSGLSDATIKAAGLYSVQSGAEITQALRWKGGGDSLAPALAFPFLHAPDYVRLKPSNPRRDRKSGDVIKYESPKGLPNRAYLSPGIGDVLADPTAALFVTVGEKKALALMQGGCPTIGLTGVYGWQRKRDRTANGRGVGPRLLIPDLARIAWPGRRVYIIFDSDATDKPTVKLAESHLAEALRGQGADVWIVRLPAGPNGEKQGADDFLVANCSEALAALIESATLPEPPDRQRAEQANGDGIPTHLTDLGNGRRLIAAHGHDLRYCYPWRKWLVWTGSHWAVDDVAEAERRAKATIVDLFKNAAAEVKEIGKAMESAPDDEARAKLQARLDSATKLARHALASEARPRFEAMLALSKSEPGVPILPADMDRDPWQFNCPNGTLDLRTGELREHRREDLITQFCPTSFDPEATCPTWLHFLDGVFPATSDASEVAGNVGMIEFVQRLLGYCMTGVTSEQMVPIFWGSGANGKTTLINCVRATLGTSYADTMPPKLLLATSSDRHPTELADLFGRRVTFASETPEGGRLNENLVKSLSGSDPIKARRMKEDFWSFEPTHKLIVCTNHKPLIRGTDHGIWRRLRLVPFTVQFWKQDDAGKPGQERPERLRADLDLPAKLAAEAPGILAWLVRGCVDWQRRGLGMPSEVAEATAMYRNEQDLIGEFITERCVIGSTDYKQSFADLYAAFTAWTKAAGEAHPLSRKALGAELKARDFEDYTSNGTWYRGIALRNDCGTMERFEGFPG